MHQSTTGDADTGSSSPSPEPAPRYLESAEVKSLLDLLKAFKEQTQSQTTFDALVAMIARLEAA